MVRQPIAPTLKGGASNGNSEAGKPRLGVIEGLLGRLTPPVARAIDGALSGHDLSVEETVALLDCAGADMQALVLAADALRREQAGELVTYVVNRNINFTNVCIKRCGFCAFSRDHRMEEGYLLPVEEIVRRAKEAWELGATEV